MSSFACEAVRVKIVPHPNADAIEIAQVGDYQSIVRKGQVRDGDLAIYIPEQAVIPEWLLKVMSLWDEAKQKGGLSGSGGNRVKAIKLRGVLSQGLILPFAVDGDGPLMLPVPGEHPEIGVAYDFKSFPDVAEGQDFAEYLGVVKYEPAIPSYLRAKVIGADHANTHKYDFDNLKKTPTMFEDGEEIIITEKIHGTNIQIGIVPSSAANERYYKGRVFVTSKGMGGNGFVLDHNDPTNLYAQTAFKWNMMDRMIEAFGHIADELNLPVIAFGEVFGLTNTGKAVQEGFTYSGVTLGLFVFDVCIGVRGKEEFCPPELLITICNDILGVNHVPILYVGPYSKEVVLEHTNGMSTVESQHGKSNHIREGVVIKSLVEGKDHMGRRKIAKSISEAYLLRKGNATEFN